MYWYFFKSRFKTFLFLSSFILLNSCDFLKDLYSEEPIPIPQPPTTSTPLPKPEEEEEEIEEDENAEDQSVVNFKQNAALLEESNRNVTTESSAAMSSSTLSSSSTSIATEKITSTPAEKSESTQNPNTEERITPTNEHALNISCSSGSAPFEISGKCSHKGKLVLFSAVNENPSLATNYPTVTCDESGNFKGLKAPWAGTWNIEHGEWTNKHKASVAVICPGGSAGSSGNRIANPTNKESNIKTHTVSVGGNQAYGSNPILGSCSHPGERVKISIQITSTVKRIETNCSDLNTWTYKDMYYYPGDKGVITVIHGDASGKLEISL